MKKRIWIFEERVSFPINILGLVGMGYIAFVFPILDKVSIGFIIIGIWMMLSYKITEDIKTKSEVVR